MLMHVIVVRGMFIASKFDWLVVLLILFVSIYVL